MKNTVASTFQSHQAAVNMKHHGVVVELIAGGPRQMTERVEEALYRHSMTEEQFAAASDEVLSAFSENDIEGAAIGVAAVSLAYPDHEANEYFKARSRVMNLRCPLMKLDSEHALPVAWQKKAEEMMDIIDDGAERLLAGFPLAV